MSAAEIVILLVVGIVVVGPQKLPGMMRTAGQWVRRLRRLSTDLRAQSGIDRILREEGLDKELRELRELKESLSRQAVLSSLVDSVNAPAGAPRARPTSSPSQAAASAAPKTTAVSSGSADVSGGAGAAERDATATARDAADSSTGLGTSREPAASATDLASRASAPHDTDDASVLATSDPAPNAAARLIRPATNTVARSQPEAQSAAESSAAPGRAKDPYPSMREREYPLWGPDHYDALPDDLDPTEEALSSSAHGHGAKIDEAPADTGMILPSFDELFGDART